MRLILGFLEYRKIHSRSETDSRGAFIVGQRVTCVEKTLIFRISKSVKLAFKVAAKGPKRHRGEILIVECIVLHQGWE